jgi:ABC-type uncharacterized transport system permease subunit
MTGSIRLLKAVQVAVSAVVLALVWLIYPGVLFAVAIAVAVGYLTACLFAVGDSRIGIWVAFLFTGLTAVLSTLGVSRVLRSGFDFLSGTYESHSELYAVPYLFLAASLGSIFVVVLHLACWRWVLYGRLPPLNERLPEAVAADREG